MTGHSPHELHLGIAEHGKVRALKGDHLEALRHYREALRLAVSSKAPEVFFRHYTQCVMESLELTGSFEDVARYCEEADKHYVDLGLDSPIHRRDHGSILERLGMVRVRAGETEKAKEALTRAVEIAGKGVLPLADEVLGWLVKSYTVEPARLLRSQQRHEYFIVRRDLVDKARARPLPKGAGGPVAGAI